MKIQMTKEEFYAASVLCAAIQSGNSNMRCEKCVLCPGCNGNKLSELVTEITKEETERSG